MAKENLSSAGEPDFDSLQIEQGRHLFSQQCKFFHGTDTLQNLPQASLPKWRLLDALTLESQALSMQ